MKHRASFVVVVWWIIALLLVGGFLIVRSPREERASDRENRMLAGAPDASVKSILSGEFMDGFESWLSDSFFARDNVISFTETVLAKTSFGEKKADDIEDRLAEELVAANEDAEDETEVEEALVAEEAEEKVELIDYTDVSGIEEEEDDAALDGKLMLYLDKTDGTREAIYTYTDDNVKTVANMLNAYRDALGEDGTVHYMQIPFSGTAYRWISNREKYCGWGCNVEDAIREQVKDGVYVHNIPDLFREPLENGEYLYFRLDHHWTPYGAWMAVSDMMKKQGYPTVDYSEYRYTVHDDFYGSEYDASDRERMHRLVDTLEVMWPLLPAKHSLVTKLTQLKETQFMSYTKKTYTAYMLGTQGPWRIIDTGYSTGRTALVICDSFGTTFTPYLMPYYDRVVMTDLRPDYYDKKKAGASVRQYIEEYGVDDVYLVMSAVSGPQKKYSLKYLMQYLD